MKKYMQRRSSQLKTQRIRLRRESLKSSDSLGLEPWPMIYRCSSLTSHSSIATGLSWSWKWSQWWRHDVAWAFRSMDQITTLVPEAMLICLRNCKQKYFLSMKQTEVLRLLPERDLCPRRLLQSIYRQRIFNRPFYWYGGHIEFLRFEEYYGMPRGHSLRELHRVFLGKKEIIITSKRGTTIFFPITIFLQENLNKNWPKRARVSTEWVNGSCSCPP